MNLKVGDMEMEEYKRDACGMLSERGWLPVFMIFYEEMRKPYFGLDAKIGFI